MRIFGYDVSNRVLISNAVAAGGLLIIVPSVMYSVYNSGCGNIVYNLVPEFNAATFSCQYLEGEFSKYCPTGLPSMFDMCMEGFQSGYQLVSDGIQNFVPSLLNQTVCNNYFGHNSSLQTCYDSLNAECWSGAWVGFSWQKSALSVIGNVTNAVRNNCQSVASYASGAVAGLTLFAGAVSLGVNALLGCRKESTAEADGERQHLRL
jgi:hypothetical protein